MRWLLAWLVAALPALAEGEKPGEFDYWVLSLSWSPNWCASTGTARGSPQCDAGAGHGWILHGLWPQYHRGYPSFCRTAARPPSRGDTAAMADIMGTSGLAWHQWKKHGTCSGLGSADYFALSREAYSRVTRPDIFRRIEREMRLPARVVEQAFLEANPGWTADMLTVTCKDGWIQEARLCLSRSLDPTPCGRDVIRDCTLEDARFAPAD